MKSLYVPLLCAALLAAGCSSHAVKSAGQAVASRSASESVVVGPGPSGNYTVQAQPAAGTCHYQYTADKQPLPDPNCTPGATNPKVTSADEKQTICAGGYTSSIRPTASITNREKIANAKSYGYTASLHDAEYDHLISLELGGDPDDPRNLWVEPPSPGHKPGAGPNNPKDTVENQLHSLVCSGKVPLADAQDAIAANWTTALSVVGHPSGK
ncbi:hypothetical protein [Nocardia alni]|uniref:hypothetical protein n=1 Tax=Nocardia alni TaxID=2815723 RepID=UPI001C22C3C1|nr:hypothetical protein [Nocardia alni]